VKGEISKRKGIQKKGRTRKRVNKMRKMRRRRFLCHLRFCIFRTEAAHKNLASS
jgi:hypothetical protein